MTVVLFHSTLNVPAVHGPGLTQTLASPLLHGYLAVPGFLVLSGFLLSMPVVLQASTLPGGLGGFLWRRSLRILPPYFAAYAFSLLFFPAWSWLFHRLGQTPGPEVLQQLETAYTWDNIASHLVLIHNFHPVWAGAMGGVFWSIACEWQIYFLFALIMVPLWRKAGIGVPVVLCLAVATLLTEGTIRGWWFYMVAQMIAVFALGMAAATIVWSTGPTATSMKRWPWGRISAGLFVLLVLTVTALDSTISPEELRTGLPTGYYHLSSWGHWIPDLMCGLWLATTIIWLAVSHPSLCSSSNAVQGPLALRTVRALESQPALFLGQIGYSLYLIHVLVVIAVSRTLNLWIPINGFQTFLIPAIATTLSIVLAYLFSQVFERPAMTRETRAMFFRERPVRTPA